MDERYLRRTIDGEEIVVDLEAGEFFTLNETATRILALYREGLHEPAVIASRIVEAYEVEPAEAQAEARRVLEEAKALGLIDA